MKIKLSILSLGLALTSGVVNAESQWTPDIPHTKSL